MAKSDYKRARLPYHFGVVPQEVLRSRGWIDLPPNAVKLAMALVAQYTGKNNGRLCPSVEALSNAGYSMSKRTAIDAKRALLECPWCLLTRQGCAPRTADWVGFTWWKLDYERSMNIGPRDFPYLNFVEMKLADPNTGRGPPPKTLQGVQKLHPTPPKRAPGGAEITPLGVFGGGGGVQKLHHAT